MIDENHIPDDLMVQSAPPLMVVVPQDEFKELQEQNLETARLLVAQMQESLKDVRVIMGLQKDKKALLKVCQYISERLSDLPLAERTPEERLEELESWIYDDILPMLESTL